MIVCFTCKPETKQQLDQLVATGHYQDHSDAIAAAIHNLNVIHSELKDARSIVIDRGIATPSSNPFPAAPPATLDRGSVVSGTATSSPAQANAEIGIPALLQLRAHMSKPPHFAASKNEHPVSAKSLAVDHWIFGQFNRILPAKVTCRALANIAAEGTDQRPLEKLAIDIANEAARFGRYLSIIDEKRNLGRDEALAVAFPKGVAPSEFKSLQRFANQFVGYANKDGEISSLPVGLKLIGRNPDNGDVVTLTEAGWQFAMMSNPILDASSPSDVEKFSDEEVAFLLDHILTSVPVEALAYRTILDQVVRGAVTPDNLDAALLRLSKKKVEASFVSTQRSGAVCRMADLDLMRRARTGTRVSYMLSRRGNEFLRLANKRFDLPESA